MARDVESLVLRMSADLRRFEKSMDSMRQTADRRLNEVERRALKSQRNLSRTMEGAGRDMVGSLRRGLGGLAPTLAAAFSTAQVIRYADSYTNLQSRLKAAGLEGERLVTIENALFEAANRNGVAIDAVAQLYQRASLSRQQLGATDEQLIALTNGVSAALRVQGVSAEAASGPLLQLGQALGAGTVRAEELNSLLEGTPIILQAAANGSARFQGNMQALAAAVREGQVTSQELFAALLAGLPELERTASTLPKTVGQALQVLNNELGRYVGQTDQSLSATQRMAQGIEALANNLDRIVPAVLALTALVGGRYVLALTAATGATVAHGVATLRLAGFQAAMTASMTGTTTATVVATGAMARLNAVIAANPIGAAVVAVGALSAAIIYLGDRLEITGQATEDTANANRALKAATDAYAEAARAAAIATGEEAAAARDNAAAKRAQAIATRDAAQAKLADAAATAAQIQAEAQRQLDLERRATIRGDRPGSVRTIGRAERQRLADAEKSAADARAAVAAANAAIAEADNMLRRPPPSSAAASSAEGGRGARSGWGRGSADQIARARAELAIEREIAEARARGDGAAVRAAEERQRLADLTRQYEAAGFEDANAQAMAHLGLLNQAEQRAEDLANWIKQSDAFWESIGENAERAAEAERTLSDQTRDRLGYEAQLARLGGNDGMIRDAERRLFIHERTLEILRLQLAATKEQAAAMAGAEWDELDRTESGRDMARSIVDVLRSDNIWEEAGRRFRDAAWDGIENLLSQLFANLGGGGQGGGNWLAQIGAAVFGGKRAMGGPVSAGRAYLVGEKRPEVFVPNSSGTIIPSVNAAMSRVGGAGGGHAAQPIIFDLSGAVVTEDLLRKMNQIGAQAQMGAVRQATVIAKKSAPGMQQQQRRLGTT